MTTPPTTLHDRRQRLLPIYRVRKVGRLWHVYHCHGRDAHEVMKTSFWSNAMWFATGDRSYRMPGFILLPGWCSW